ncbi:hypothetical protein DSOUD_0708 [Desulfuromonas soudanensis]|uniref:DUF86 domain-containing protein n=1 Tax=Desulfuromonas soudanensis TaxID=1603606 RepID=A0A0M4CZL2_9BACT|nr:HepT-like ribonuclease domain-containing protein [Desulfuromonas soudanensis]ALC15496.1 hypothetical protein DSOUD_0708 [Desulfuromonas soudanensis]
MSRSDRDRTYILHILECIDRVERYANNDRTRFDADPMVQDAILRSLQVMAESSQRLSEEVKATQSHIDWRAISGFRNILVHDYLGVDLDLIWQVIKQELPVLKKSLKALS